MNAPHRSTRFTNAEFDRLVRSGGLGDVRVELRRGMILKMSPQHLRHGRVKRLLAEALKVTLAANLPWLVEQEVTVDFGTDFAPLPDIAVWDPTSLPAEPEDGAIPASAVRLVVEVSDHTVKDDLGDKREEYAKCGLAEYWVADANARVLHQFSGAGFATQKATPFGERIVWFTRPDLIVDTAALK